MSLIRNIVENIRDPLVQETELLDTIKTRPTGLKNIIINGGFDVWQRGTSAVYTANASGYKTTDRIRTSNRSDGQFTISKSEINGSNAIRTTVDAAVTTLATNNYWYGISHIFEGQHLYSIVKQGKNITISFLFNSNVTGEFSVCMRNLTNYVLGYESYVTSFSYTTVNVPQRVSITLPLGYAFTIPLQNNESRGFDIVIGFLNQDKFVTSTLNQWQSGSLLATPTAVNWGAVVGNFWEIAELQLEEGDVNTSFERRPYGLELSLCQRYYQSGNMYILSYPTSNSAFAQYSLGIRMRSTPAVIRAENLTNLSYTTSYTNKNIISEYYAIVDTTASASGNLYWKADAEL